MKNVKPILDFLLIIVWILIIAFDINTHWIMFVISIIFWESDYIANKLSKGKESIE